MSVDDGLLTRSGPSGDPFVADRRATTLVVAWQHPVSRLIEPVGFLEFLDENLYRFRYLRRATEVDGFQPFLGFPEWEVSYTSSSLFPLFSQRIMSDRRRDFSEFLRQLHLGSAATPWEQLARSEGRRTGDTIQVFPVPAVDADGSSTCFFLVHGIRHVRDGALPPLGRDEELVLIDMPENPVNPNAVLVCTQDGARLGYVPDLLLEHLGALRGSGPVRLRVEHVNGVDVPVHLRLLVRLDGAAPPGYVPMKGPTWMTFADTPGA